MHVLTIYCDVHPNLRVARIYPRERFEAWNSPETKWREMPFNTPETLDLPAEYDSPALTRSYRLGCPKCRDTAFVEVNANQLREVVWAEAKRREVTSLTIKEMEGILTK